MQPVHLSDQLYQEAQRRAAVAGFENVDAYVAYMLSHDFQLADENLDHLFTPERLALIDQAAADVAAGNAFTLDEARASLARTRDAWLREHANGS